MLLHGLKSKIHRATVTDADLNYEGSITIDVALCEAAHMHQFERVEIYNVNNGERFATYVLYGKTGEICVNGAAARLVHHGDKLIIATYAFMSNEELSSHKPRVVLVNEDNGIKEIKSESNVN